MYLLALSFVHSLTEWKDVGYINWIWKRSNLIKEKEKETMHRLASFLIYFKAKRIHYLIKNITKVRMWPVFNRVTRISNMLATLLKNKGKSKLVYTQLCFVFYLLPKFL